ncbi:MAG: Bacterial antitoxin of ParD toxin-antitoxin type system [Thermomicrobiales bacterium]|jgi:putative addiction module CopG family antidote|nr:Bacterial antitoxin of ParD toxin-antitoxin type system [Thermomicrobiales bacterium]MEA2528247.1 Bacterial antitoxin of ParD toxin-antitoxin type system [Thermomicrobiales bacterium]MEA2531791.1 Bacterial antitoxin of ParD toxin-antitoxin type system [Thermomicrobiales bacterium]MEA2596810.1 Bacterial antitoxin of ParD toxin-antitoxin type system [Thermomicrobiales bacterium]
MSVTLPPELEAMVRQKVDEGLYADVDSVVQEALRLLDRRDRRERLRAALVEGEEGEGIPYTPELLEEIDREVEERFLRGELPHPDVCP